MAHLRVELAGGVVLDAEGSEDFLTSVYRDFREGLARQTEAKPKQPHLTPEVKPGPEEPKQDGRGAGGKKRTSTSKPPQMVNDLNLAGNGCVGIREFIARYSPSNNQERNVLFTYYLSTILKKQKITYNDIFTCYRFVNLKIPGNIVQSLLDTKRRTGRIDTSSLDDIKLTVHGINFVEHDLRPAKEVTNA